MKWWRGWKAASWCGNCAESQNSENNYRIYFALNKLNREDEAIAVLEKWTFEPHIESTPKVPVALVEHYRQQGKLSTLEAKLHAALKKSSSAVAAAMALRYIELIHARERKDAAALWKPFERKSHRTLEYLEWEAKYGAKFLVELGDDAKAFLIAKAKSAPKSDEDQTSDASSWACLLLAKMGAPEVLPVLQDRLKYIKNAQELKYRFWALAILNTGESRAILEKHARSGMGKWQTMARKVLALLPSDKPIPFLVSDEQLLNSGPGLENHWEFNQYHEDQ